MLVRSSALWRLPFTLLNLSTVVCCRRLLGGVLLPHIKSAIIIGTSLTVAPLSMHSFAELRWQTVWQVSAHAS